MQNPFAKDRLFLVQWLLLSAFLLILGVFVALDIYFEHQRIDSAEREQLLAQTKVVEQNMVRQLEAISLSLDSVRSDWARWAKLKDGKDRAIRHLKTLIAAMPGVRTILITDAHGNVTSSNREQIIGQNFQTRDYFQAPLRNPSANTLYISPPFTTSLGIYSMTVARAIIGADGRFAGVLSATLAPEQFEVLMNSVRYTQDTWVALAHGAGAIFMMVPEQQNVIGMNVAKPGTFFTLHTESKQATSVFSGKVYATGENRMIALRTVQPAKLQMDQPMVMAVTRDLQAIFAGWRRDAYIQGGLMAIVTLVSVLGLLFYQRRQRAYLAERDRIVEQLRDTGEELERFFTLSLDLLCIADMQGHFLRLNHAWENTLGYPLAELEGSAFLDYVHPDDVEATLAVMSNLESDKNDVRGFTNRYRCKDGSYRWIEWHSKPFQQTLIYAVARDVTEQKLNENILKESEERYRALFDFNSDAIFSFNFGQDGRLVVAEANEVACQRLGYTCEEILGMELVKLDAPGYPLNNTAVMQEFAQHGHVLFESVHMTKDGRKIPVEVHARAYTLHGVPMTLGVARDISERKLAEKEKNDMRRNQRALLNAIQETTFLMERNGTLLIINEVGAKRLNATPDELVGKNMLEQFSGKVAASRRAKFDEIALKGKPEFFEDERPGHRFYNAIYPIADAQGVVQRFAVYAAEITQQHRQKLIDDILSEINQEILQGVPLYDVLDDICRKVAEAFQLEVVWLGRKEAGGMISVLAGAGSAAHYVEALKITGVRWDDSPQGRGPSGSAIRFGQPQVFKVNDPRFQTWSKSALENNLQSIFTIPLVIRSEIYGVFALYSSDPALFESDELTSQLKSIGKRICIALEAAMDQQQVRLLSSALEAAGNGVMITDPKGKILWANPAFVRLCGYSKEELLGHTPRMLKSGKQTPEYYQALWAAIGNGENWSSETIERAKDGTLYTVSQTITPIFNDGELTHFIAIHEDISAQKLTQNRIEHMAHFDALTGLPNRALFYDRLRQALALAKRNDGGLALLYLDLDGFKQINDRMGHHAGDLLLVAVAERLGKCIRESDTVARLGGDEFTIILNETFKHEDVSTVANKIIAAIALPFDLDGQTAQIGISIGIARYAEEAGTEDELMKLADAAMYEAKAAGKNTYRPSMPK